MPKHDAINTVDDAAPESKAKGKGSKSKGGVKPDDALHALEPEAGGSKAKGGSSAATPQKAEVKEFLNEATAKFNALSPDVKERYLNEYGLSSKEVVAIILYSTNAAYKINEVLRGIEKDPAYLEAYQPHIDTAVKALAKLPKDAINDQGGKRIDAKKGDDKRVEINTVYRNLAWAPFFNGLFKSKFKVGQELSDAAFMSTTLIKNSYGPEMPVKQTIGGVREFGGKSIFDISQFAEEAEALFPPGMRMRIEAIQTRAGRAPEEVSPKSLPKPTVRGLADPIAEYPHDAQGSTNDPQAFNQKGLVWEIKCQMVGAKSQEPKPAGAKKAPPKSDPLTKLISTNPYK